MGEEQEKEIKEKDELARHIENYWEEGFTPYGIASNIYNIGYRKIVWHKPSDGDLPKPNTDVIYIAYTIGGVLKYYDMGVYNHVNKCWYGNICNTNTNSVIAWTELPSFCPQCCTNVDKPWTN